MISNEEIINRFDVLYNNTMSNQAPSLDAYEMSVFFNKAQLEVLKNHLNPKGNKYSEGFDGSSKRQSDFSNLIVNKTYYLYPKASRGFSITGNILNTRIIETDLNGKRKAKVIQVPIDYNSILSVINETVEVLGKDEAEDYRQKIDNPSLTLVPLDVNNDGSVNITDVTSLIDLVSNWSFEGISQELIDNLDIDELSQEDKLQAIQTLINVLSDGKPREIILTSPVSINFLYRKYGIRGKNIVVVPITFVEYDTLMSRPYKYPPSTQAWRLFVNNSVEVITSPNELPVLYNIRYIKVPDEVDLANDEKTCELPDFLIDEVLQRAVELAKNAWEGNIETTKALGERSE